MHININNPQFDPDNKQISPFFAKKHGHVVALIELVVLLAGMSFLWAMLSIRDIGVLPSIDMVLLVMGGFFVFGAAILWFGHKSNEKTRLRTAKYYQYLEQFNESQIIEFHSGEEHEQTKKAITDYLNQHYLGWNEKRSIVRRRSK